MSFKELNKIDILYIKGLLYTGKQIKQAQFEELQQAKAKTPEYIYITNILHIQNELEQITSILNKLKG